MGVDLGSAQSAITRSGDRAMNPRWAGAAVAREASPMDGPVPALAAFTAMDAGHADIIITGCADGR
jgi:hypothetical protein